MFTKNRDNFLKVSGICVFFITLFCYSYKVAALTQTSTLDQNINTKTSVQTSPINANNPSYECLETFDGICLRNYNDFTQIDKIAKALNFSPIPQNIQEGDPVLAKKGGKSYTKVPDSRVASPVRLC